MCSRGSKNLCVRFSTAFFFAAATTAVPAYALHPVSWHEENEPMDCMFGSEDRFETCDDALQAAIAQRDRVAVAYYVWLTDRLAHDGAPRDLALAAVLRSIAVVIQAKPTVWDGEWSAEALVLLDEDAKAQDWAARATGEGADDIVVRLLLARSVSSRDQAR
jgi:hypothetical protein